VSVQNNKQLGHHAVADFYLYHCDDRDIEMRRCIDNPQRTLVRDCFNSDIIFIQLDLLGAKI
jgi:hypothetical protein